jgi:hypothetical protein
MVGLAFALTAAEVEVPITLAQAFIASAECVVDHFARVTRLVLVGIPLIY